MRRFISKTFIYLGIFSLVMGTISSLGNNLGYADNIELIGGELGLEVSPSRNLFNLINLNPGDSEEAEINIKNNYSQSFGLTMKAERTSEKPEDGADLFEQLEITVEYDGETIYSGKMSEFATSSIDLGRFNPGNGKKIKAEVKLLGPETGNEYQGTSVDVKWIFEATLIHPPGTTDPDPEAPEEDDDTEIEVDDDVDIDDEGDDTEIEVDDDVDILEDKLPKTGSKSNLILQLIGMALLALGLAILPKKIEED